MKIESVLGSISPDSLGITLCHEHILVSDMLSWYQEPKDPSKRALMNMRLEDIGMENLGKIRLDPMFVKDNLVLDEKDVAIKELKDFKQKGGKSVVDVTLPSQTRNPRKIKEISKKAGINIVAATGWYVVAAHPPFIKRKSVDQLCAMMVKDLTEGIGETKIKAGIIGELGCSQPAPYHPDEEKVIKAGVKAQNITGACITIHPCLFDMKISKVEKMGNYCIDLLEKEGADLDKFYLSHADWGCQDINYLKKMLDRGTTISFDSFGACCDSQLNTLSVQSRIPCDAERISALVELCNMGYDKQVIVSHDVGMKIHLKKYGGYGYSHILENIIPVLLREGVSKKQINKILTENPRRLLAH
jgi:phosphotriesterase-related protein